MTRPELVNIGSFVDTSMERGPGGIRRRLCGEQVHFSLSVVLPLQGTPGGHLFLAASGPIFASEYDQLSTHFVEEHFSISSFASFLNWLCIP